MLLFSSLTSPYTRKVRAAIRFMELSERVQETFVNPFERPAELVAASPLSQIPTLVTDSGQSVTGSGLILEYLQTQVPEKSLYPVDLETQFYIRNLSNVADGLMDNGLAILLESRRPQPFQFADAVIVRKETLQRIISYMDAQELPDPKAFPNLFALSLGCGLGYVDFRVPDFAWREMSSRLADWYEVFSNQLPMRATAPPVDA